MKQTSANDLYPEMIVMNVTFLTFGEETTSCPITSLNTLSDNADNEIANSRREGLTVYYDSTSDAIECQTENPAVCDIARCWFMSCWRSKVQKSR